MQLYYFGVVKFKLKTNIEKDLLHACIFKRYVGGSRAEK
jgi:hypothetical protein